MKPSSSISTPKGTPKVIPNIAKSPGPSSNQSAALSDVHDVCLELLRDGQVKAFVELFSLLELQQAQAPVGGSNRGKTMGNDLISRVNSENDNEDVILPLSDDPVRKQNNVSLFSHVLKVRTTADLLQKLSRLLANWEDTQLQVQSSTSPYIRLVALKKAYQASQELSMFLANHLPGKSAVSHAAASLAIAKTLDAPIRPESASDTVNAAMQSMSSIDSMDESPIALKSTGRTLLESYVTLGDALLAEGEMVVF
jgi:hypothetical protein